MEGLEILSNVLGWLYFFAWSISFWPQVIQNYRRKSVVGLSFDFIFYNFTGFFCYSVYNCVLFFDSAANPDNVDVQANDVAFALHALFMTLVTIIQCFMYERGNNGLSLIAQVVVISLWVVIINEFLGVLGTESWPSPTSSPSVPTIVPSVSPQTMALAYFVKRLGYVKMCLSFFKYIPQAFMNYKRKSTVGWSIGNILLDLTGGLLSFAQDFVNVGRGKYTFNFPKVFLAVESVGFDVLFIIQHYVLYKNREDPYLQKDEYGKVQLLEEAQTAETNEGNHN